MSHLMTKLVEHAEQRPDALALDDGARQLSYRDLLLAVEALAKVLALLPDKALALQADNGIDWVLTDLAAISLQKTLIPIPHFFSAEQLRFVLERTGVRTLLCQEPLALPEDKWRLNIPHLTCTLQGYQFEGLNTNATSPPEGCAKVTFTSGSTGHPKGVCLSQEHMESVAMSLLDTTEARPDDRHLCLLPMATLLENLAGIYLPLMAGATCLVPPLAKTGLQGSSSLDVTRQLACLSETRATSAILVPQMLLAQLSAFRAGLPCPSDLRFVAVGGGRVSPTALKEARAFGLPVFEGYGLSEAASVVSLNTPQYAQPGGVGRALPHVSLQLAEDGEILIENSPFLGYLGEPARDKSSFATGDIGRLDEAGFLQIIGRKKHLFISSFGRNISPEWVESECQTLTGIRQIAVFGDGRPFMVAVVVPMPGTSALDIDHQIDQANFRLPDYARIRRWTTATRPFTADNGQLTTNGRLRRDQIFAAYADQIAALY